MAFTPNMSSQEIAEHDAQRGQGNVELFHNPAVVTAKKPWQNPDGTHKSQNEEEKPMSTTSKATEVLKRSMRLPDGKDFGKPVTERKREGESEFERQIRHYTNEAKDNPEKYPGGQKQAIAIAASESGESKKGIAENAARAATQRAHEREQGRKERSIGARMLAKKSSPVNGRLESLSKYTSKGVMNQGAGASMGIGAGAPAAPSPTSTGATSAPSMTPPPPPSSPGAMRMSVKSPNGTDQEEEPNIADQLFGKALTSRSMHVLPPMRPYDPFGINRSAAALPVHSAAIGESNAPIVRPADVYKSCLTHGISYKADVGCHPCKVYKSTTCEKCGNDKTKKAGGMLACSHGH